MGNLSKYVKYRLATYFKLKLGAVHYRKGWTKSTCPHCGKEDKYGINLGLNRTNCFRCGEHPSPVSLVMALEKLDTYSDFKVFIDKMEVTSMDFIEEDIELASKTIMDMPEGFNLFGSQDDSTIARIAQAYIKKRGFEIKRVRSMGWGYCSSGDLFGYLIIPYYEQGKLVYYNARRIIGSGPRYKNPDTEHSGVGKSFLIYNREALFLYDKVYLCEGAINATTLSEKAISSGGKAVSRYQINLITRSPAQRVVIVLDPDAKLKAIETAIHLCETKKVKVVFLPDGKDINDIGKKEAMQYIRSTPYQGFSELLMLKQRVLQNESTIYTYN